MTNLERVARTPQSNPQAPYKPFTWDSMLARIYTKRELASIDKPLWHTIEATRNKAVKERGTLLPYENTYQHELITNACKTVVLQRQPLWLCGAIDYLGKYSTARN